MVIKDYIPEIEIGSIGIRKPQNIGSIETFRQRPSAIAAMIFSKLNGSIRSRIAAHRNQPPVRQAASKPTT